MVHSTSVLFFELSLFKAFWALNLWYVNNLRQSNLSGRTPPVICVSKMAYMEKQAVKNITA